MYFHKPLKLHNHVVLFPNMYIIYWQSVWVPLYCVRFYCASRHGNYNHTIKHANLHPPSLAIQTSQCTYSTSLSSLEIGQIYIGQWTVSFYSEFHTVDNLRMHVAIPFLNCLSIWLFLISCHLVVVQFYVPLCIMYIRTMYALYIVCSVHCMLHTGSVEGNCTYSNSTVWLHY